MQSDRETRGCSFVERFEGAPLKNVAAIVDGTVARGDPIVTRRGLEGGPIYAHSARIRRNIDESGFAGMTIDLRPDLSHDALAARSRCDRWRSRVPAQ